MSTHRTGQSYWPIALASAASIGDNAHEIDPADWLAFFLQSLATHQNADQMRLIGRFAELFIRARVPLFGACVVIAAFSIGPSLKLDFDRSIESMFRPDDPRYENYREDKRLFGGLETSVVAYDDRDLVSAAGLRRLERFAQSLREIAGVKSVFSLADVRRPSAPFNAKPLSEQLESGTVTAAELREEVLATRLYRGRLVSSSGATAVLLVELDPAGKDAATRAETIRQVRDICDSHDRPAVFAGGPVLVDDVFTHLEEDGVTLGVASSLILTLVIAVLFRNLRWILLPLSVVQLTLVWTKALLAVSGMQMSMVSSPLVALVTVIGVATVVHVTVRFREERLNAEPTEALRRTFTNILPAIFWTCLTTAAGFAALTISSISPVKSFGIMMAIGSGLVFFATLGLAPTFVLSFRSIGTDPSRAPGEGKLAGMLDQIIHGVERHPWRVVLIFVSMLGLTSLGILRLQVATDFTENFRKSSPIVQSYEFLASRMGAVNSMDILVDVPDALSPEFEPTIQRLRQLQKELETIPEVGTTLSVADLLDFVDQPADQSPSAKKSSGLLSWLPKLPGIGQQAQFVVLNLFEPKLVAGFWNRDENVARIMIQTSHVKGAERKRQLVERIEQVSERYFPSARSAGIYVLLTYFVQSLLADQWYTFATSLASIFLLMTIAFRSWRLGLAAMLPNAAPIVMVVGAMGWLGLKVNMATAMLSSVSMGLAVDFSIHYLYRFQYEMRRGIGFYEALRMAHGSVGVAMVMANLALIAGFLALVMSSLIPTVHFGILVSVAMLGGLAGNLIVLPLILRLLWQIGCFRDTDRGCDTDQDPC